VQQGFPDTSQVLLRKNNKINLSFFIAVPAGSWEVTVAFNFISERTIFIN
jgi:urea transporter